jgi:hypothetical protein
VTIRRGEDWGRTGPAPADLEWCDDDAAVANAYRNGVRSIGVRGGDLARTLGVGPETSADVEATVSFPIDVVELTASDGRRTAAAAHVVVRRRRRGWWRGPILVVMNAQYIGRADVAPRGHPNDGRVDVLEVDAAMSIRQRIMAARRLPIGTHVPHPLVRTRSLTTTSFVVSPSSMVDVDGRRWIDGTSSDEITVTIDVVPDALQVWIPGVRLAP